GGRCRVGAGTLPDLNPGCGDGALCDAPQATGACADCHAPGIDGVLGGRDLLDATGIAHDHGVHCDVCHKVAAVDLDAPAGVGGRLVVVRPSEPSTVTTLDWDPLTFGPVADVVNPRMGSVYAPVFHEATLCAGCHELRQAALVPGTDVDRARWPDGTLPIQSTWSEWSAGPLAGVAPCQSCHMPPDAEAGNTADIDLVPSPRVGRIAGWWRPAGTSRHHSWDGPRSADGALLKLAATLEVATARDADTLSVDVTVRHTGAGHALPTGEPFRAVILAVSATCDGTPLVATGGDAIPFAGGAWARQEAGGDWSRWPGARVGQVVRVVRHDGWRDDPSPGPFGDGTFTGAAAGNRHLQVVGQATITAVDGDGRVTFDAALPEGDEAFLGDAGALVPGQAGRAVAGAPGHAFARVLADADGALQVPHHRAVDVVSDNRLVPGTAVHTTHTFAATCADPVVTAQLVWRGLPVTLVAERGWTSPDRPIAEVVR
ncbi:MAG: hypothetical protein H6733_17440, partial [Alphaproteobacteria bacterium]|nr:hypothetical protein [Alphaproteobacteria bacterium]